MPLRFSCTCQMHVSPGVTSSRRLNQPVHCSASWTGKGRGPTSDMSPRSTFQSCGNSSRFVFRSSRPTGVIRGSRAILNAGPSCSFSALSSRCLASASAHIVRSL
jgi:hypothetical protein